MAQQEDPLFGIPMQRPMTPAEMLRTKDFAANWHGEETLMGRLNEWADLHKAKKDLDATVENVKAAMAAMEEKILEGMGADGVTNVKMAQGTVYVHTAQFANIVQDKKAFAALRRAGWGDLVKATVNTQSLSAVVREKGVPRILEKHVTVHEKTSLRLRST